jgi:hypothetical protein
MAEPPTVPDTTYTPWKAFLLLAAIFSASACAIVYELLIGSTSAYFLGDSVEQFSVTIGLFPSSTSPTCIRTASAIGCFCSSSPLAPWLAWNCPY